MESREHKLFSNKIFLEGSSAAQKAVLEVENGLITDIQVLDESPDLRDQSEIIDYSGMFIFPGLIDFNVKCNFEGLAATSQLALKGGGTTIAVESSFHPTDPSTDSRLFCDVGEVCRVQSESDINESALALKAYLCPQSETVHSAKDLPLLVSTAHQLSKPLIIDPSIAMPRVLYVASPQRMQKLSNRLAPEEPTEKIGDFSMAVEVSVNGCMSGSEEEDQPEKIMSPRRKSVVPASSDFSITSLEVAESINKDQLFMKELVNAELETYKYTDGTYNRSKSDVLAQSPIHARDALNTRLRSLRPSAISILKPLINERS